MLMNPFLAQKFAEERIKNALRGADEARLVKTIRKSKGTRPFLLSIMQRHSDWWKMGNGNNQPTIDNMKQRKRRQNLAG